MAQRGMVQVKRRGQWEDLMPFVGNEPFTAVQKIRTEVGLPTRVLDADGNRMRHAPKETDS